MIVHIYADESGVFDQAHYRYFTFGGLILLGDDQKELWSRKYSASEKSINSNNKYGQTELKAARLSVKDKNKLFRSLNQCHKFGIVVDMDKLLPNIFDSKKYKQRYLDYVFWSVCEEALLDLIAKKIVNEEDIEQIVFNLDYHSTATNGEYELQQMLEEEFVYGTFNYDYSKYYKPVLNNCKSVKVQFLDSKMKVLIRAADIVANKMLFCADNDKLEGLNETYNMFVMGLPETK